MNKAILIFSLILTPLIAFAQIKNPGFELQRDTLKTMPQNWWGKGVNGFTMMLDSSVKYSGAASLMVRNINNTEPRAYQPFEQTVDVDVNKATRLTLSAYINTKKAKTYAGLWCQVLDANQKAIGFKNMATTDSSGWKKYSLKLVADSGARRLVLGGFLLGGGTAWFDDFEISFTPMDAPASPTVKRYVDRVLDIVKGNSIFSDKLDWASIDKQTQKLSRGLDDVDDAGQVTDYVISQLRAVGDNHSFLQNKVMATNYVTKNANPVRPAAKLMPGNIGYISVPAFGSTSDTACVNFAMTIQNLISNIDTRNDLRGWIVDLRGNGGGNMYPMMAGLGPLIGDGDIGYFIKPVKKKKVQTAWYLRQGVTGTGSYKGTSIAPYHLKKPENKIAVLVGPGTASSGEMTALSFIGKPNAKLIGGKTGGYTTANVGFPLSNGAMFYLSTGYIADRNKKEYLGKLTPDILVEPSTNDEAVFMAAMDWISGK